MNNSSLEFFKSLLDRDKAVLDMLTELTGPSLEKQYDKPYSNIKFVNDVLTVILKDGSIISKHPATIDHFNLAREARSEVELFAICSS